LNSARPKTGVTGLGSSRNWQHNQFEIAIRWIVDIGERLAAVAVPLSTRGKKITGKSSAASAATNLTARVGHPAMAGSHLWPAAADRAEPGELQSRLLYSADG
jgi:hypothetical protein